MTVRKFNILFMPLGIIALIISAFALSNDEKQNNGGQTIDYRGTGFNTFTVDPSTHEITLHWKDEQQIGYLSIKNLLNALKKQNKEVLMITNAGMYTPSRAPVGLYIENEQELVSINTRDGSGNFSLKPNGVFYLDDKGAHVTETTKYLQESVNKPIKYATQSGPMLVINGAIHPAFTKGSRNVYIRSGVGIDSLGKAVFAISKQPVNLYTFASLFKDQLGCQKALYLDGAISLMYIPGISEQMGGNFGPIISVTTK